MKTIHLQFSKEGTPAGWVSKAECGASLPETPARPGQPKEKPADLHPLPAKADGAPIFKARVVAAGSKAKLNLHNHPGNQVSTAVCGAARPTRLPARCLCHLPWGGERPPPPGVRKQGWQSLWYFTLFLARVREPSGKLRSYPFRGTQMVQAGASLLLEGYQWAPQGLGHTHRLVLPHQEDCPQNKKT